LTCPEVKSSDARILRDVQRTHFKTYHGTVYTVQECKPLNIRLDQKQTILDKV